jgi:hypothetical protein
MLIHFQFPVVDLRALIGPEGSRLPVPSWPTPLHDEEFVRSMGIVRRRPNGGLPGWIAEEHYCDARKSIKLNPEFIANPDLGYSKFRVAFRRFYFDGTVVAKFEIGFTTSASLDILKVCSFDDLLAKFLALPVRVGNSAKKYNMLVESGKLLAHLYETASSRHHTKGFFDNLNLPRHEAASAVISGSPAIFVDIEPDDVPVDLINKFGHEFIMKNIGLCLFYRRVRVNARSFPVWTVIRQGHLHVIEARNLRIYLLRLNAENQTMVRVLKAISADEIKPKHGSPESDVLQLYLNKATTNILRLSGKSREFAASDEDLMSLAAVAAEYFLSTEERESALNHLETLRIRKNIFRKMKSFKSIDTAVLPASQEMLKDASNPTYIAEPQRHSPNKSPADVITIKPSIWGVSIDVKEAWRYGVAWWRSRY